MGAALAVEMKFYWQTCINCGIIFGMPEDYDKRLRENRNIFYCPNGHGQHYTGQNTEEQLRKQLESEKKARESAERDAEWQRAQARNARIQETKAKNKLKRTMDRVNAGVCPHCNRTFKQLAAHMRSKHPDKAPAAEPSCNHDGGGDA